MASEAIHSRPKSVGVRKVISRMGQAWREREEEEESTN